MLVFWLMAVPLLGALLVLALPGRFAKWVSGIIGLIDVAFYAMILWGSHVGVNWAWIPAWGIRFHLAADGLSLFLLGLTVVLFTVALLASDALHARAYFFWMLLLEFAAIGLFAAMDLFLFYIFWEVLLIPVFFLLTGWSGKLGRPAAMRWLVMNLVGSLFMLVGVIAVAVIHAQGGHGLTFEINQLAGTPLASSVAPWLFVAFMLAFVIKAPLWPFHGWLPETYSRSEAPVTAVISGVLSKAGIYGIMRVMLPLFMPEFRQYQEWLLIFAVAGLIYGALMALRQTDMKMVTSYGSLSHMGMMALGVFTLTQAGILGTTFYMVAHGLMVGGLFLVLGLLEKRTGKRTLADMGGLNQSAPRLAAYFLFFALGVLGLPGLPGFAGEYMIFQGLVVHHLVFAIIAGGILIVAAWYMIRVFQAVMQGPAPAPSIPDLYVRQVVWMVPLAAMVVVLGMWPAGITTHVTPSLYHAVHILAAKGGGQA